MSSEGLSPLWTEHFKISSSDVDWSRRATCMSLCRFLLEGAWNHAEALGVGFKDLARQQKYWVLSRLRLEVDRWPAWGAKVTLQTWPRPTQGAFALRDFKVADDGGTLMAGASSAWLILDANSKRPQRVQRILPGWTGWVEESALGRDPDKLPDIATWPQSFSAHVRYTDIDVNGHVNSSRYIGWILDAYPADFHRAHAVRTLAINYLAETLAGEVLSVRSRTDDGNVWSHSLCKADGQEVCRARLHWKTTPAVASGDVLVGARGGAQ